MADPTLLGPPRGRAGRERHLLKLTHTTHETGGGAGVLTSSAVPSPPLLTRYIWATRRSHSPPHATMSLFANGIDSIAPQQSARCVAPRVETTNDTCHAARRA